MADLNPYAQNEIITTMVHVLPNATNATKLVILPVTVGVWQVPTMLTTRRALGQARDLLVMSVKDKPRLQHHDGSQIDITPIVLDHYYDVELADGRIIRRNWEHEARLHIISYTKIQEYMLKGCPVFLANINTKVTEDKSEKKRLEDVPIIQDFPDVFPKGLSGLLLTRQVEFQIDLIPGVAPVAQAPYRLAPSEMKELSEQLKELSDKGFIRPSSSPWAAPVLFVKKKDGSF
ncbi:hypothetical protein Tco_0143440 [Tanacetum coccineum]